MSKDSGKDERVRPPQRCADGQDGVAAMALNTAPNAMTMFHCDAHARPAVAAETILGHRVGKSG